TWVAQGAAIPGQGLDAPFGANNVAITCTGVTSGQNLLVRFGYIDAFYQSAGLNWAGPWIDNVRISATSAGAWTAGTPPAAPTTYWSENFNSTTPGTLGTWSTYGLAETDGILTSGCDVVPWGTWNVCTPVAPLGQWTGNAMTVASDGGVCGTYYGDLARDSDFNVVSPIINLSSATGTVVFEALEAYGIDGLAPGNGMTVTYYAANNPPSGNPAAWGAARLTINHVLGEPSGTQIVSFPVTDLNGQTQVRIRIQITTPTGTCSPDPCTDFNTACSYVAMSHEVGFDDARIGASSCP
ncbi:MAG: hypothetical protein ABI743_12735, partial [bacterium]